MAKAGFDLASEPWAGVIWRNPTPTQPSALGFRDLLTHAHEIQSLAITPAPALSAVYRLLYAMVARIAGLDEDSPNGEDWFERREEIQEQGLNPDAVAAYFNKFDGRFDLFDDKRPFLQDPRLADPAVCPKAAGVNKLVLGRPAGNNAVWFGHHWDASPVPIPTAEAFASLLIWLYYGPSGRCATRVHDGTSAADVSAGPLRSSLSYHLEGDSLLDTLLAGLLIPDPDVRGDQDLCPWELPDLPDPLQAPHGTRPYNGPRSRLTGGWQHALLLVPDETGQQVTDAYITWGRRTKQPPTNDPYVIHQISKQGNRYARPADAGRALWRDLDGLLQLDTNNAARPQRPEVFGNIAEMAEYKVRALGFEQDGKTKDVQFVSAVTPPLPIRVQETDPRRAKRIGDLRAYGSVYGSRLDFAAKKAWATLTGNKLGRCAWGEQAAAAYWPEAEEIFWQRVRDDDFTEPWKTFRAAAIRAFDDVTHRHVRDTRSARAVEQARLELFGGRSKKK
ncbi:type I-E CRISPR-associated protein Cse1/CasA [Actinomadura hibisca]|uniref:type I-E CRISPR-associated protein Cse1/CasA n=1 Tax=Actinomadura hibisca TaxID=68565 RepID=UPI000836C225|nr:type I-E CRISPR-associated protein Cse1/CasA [Actinomadura hibisca]